MATAISEEKVSSDLENNYVKEKLAECENGNDTMDGDAVLDEMEAKIERLDLTKDSTDEEAKKEQYAETIRRQGETINKLVQQLRQFFEDYQEISREKEYYEELNDALIQCLEISEGRAEIYDSDEEGEGNQNDKQNENFENVESETHKTAIDTEKSDELRKDDMDESATKSGEENTTETNMHGEEEDVKDEEEKEVKKLTKKELLKINHILLREVYELRYQITSIIEQIHQGDIEDIDSEYDDSDTVSDGHVCAHCSGEKLGVSTEKTDNVDDENKEEYEHADDDDKVLIKDETDTE